jgi:hypothetical protein
MNENIKMNNEEFVVKLKKLEKINIDYKEGPFITLVSFFNFGLFLFLGFYFQGLIKDFGISGNWLVLTTVILIFLTIGMFLVSVFLTVSKLDPKWGLTWELEDYVYTGNLKNIFDFSVPEINKVLTEMDKEIEASIIRNKGLRGCDILLIQEKIKPFTDKISAESKEKEEMIQQEDIKKALMEAETVSGKMLKDFDDLIKK